MEEMWRMSLNIFIERFKSTANIRISQIAYIFTANRLKEYRDKGMTYRAESTKVIQDIGHKILNDEYNYSFIMAAFDHFKKNWWYFPEDVDAIISTSSMQNWQSIKIIFYLCSFKHISMLFPVLSNL